MAELFQNSPDNLRDLFDRVPFFSPKLRFSKIRNRLSSAQFEEENGFTLVELIVVVMMIGILSSIAIPQFMSAADKAKQKEASAIVASILKAASAYQTEYGALPQDFGDISEYARFQKCDESTTNVANDGGAACKPADTTPIPVPASATQFYSTSGHYDVEIDVGGSGSSDDPYVFQVRANPNGGAYETNGSAVVGCYNPTDTVSQVREYRSTEAEKGGNPKKPFPTC